MIRSSRTGTPDGTQKTKTNKSEEFETIQEFAVNRRRPFEKLKMERVDEYQTISQSPSRENSGGQHFPANSRGKMARARRREFFIRNRLCRNRIPRIAMSVDDVARCEDATDL